jgi:hypothetical protein
VSGGRPGSFFHGAELRGLIIFAVLMAVGWPVILSYARKRDAPPPAPPVVDNRPLEPDKGLAFDGLQDKVAAGARELTAFKILLQRARETPVDELDRKARRDVLYANLWDRPDLYRGVAIHLEGTLLKTLAQEGLNENLVPKKRAFEVYFSTPDSRPFPYIVWVEDPPPGLVIGPDQNERIVVDAYFLRLHRYTAGDGDRAAPLLIGKLRWAKADPNSGAPAGPAPDLWSAWMPYVVCGMVVVYLGFRFAYQYRRARRPTVPRPSILLTDPPRDEIGPDELSSWLEKLPDEDDEDDPERTGH